MPMHHVNITSKNAIAHRRCSMLREEQQKYNQTAARLFLETTLGTRLTSNNLHQELQDGVLLCQLINRLQPGTIANIGNKNTPFVKMVNISQFLDGARELGVHSSLLFQPADLYEAKNMDAVVLTILSLARVKNRDPRTRNTSPWRNSDTTTRHTALRQRQPKAQTLNVRPDGEGRRHVRSIFDQQPSTVKSSEWRSMDPSRITEKAEELRRTYRSKSQSQLSGNAESDDAATATRDAQIRMQFDKLFQLPDSSTEKEDTDATEERNETEDEALQEASEPDLDSEIQAQFANVELLQESSTSEMDSIQDDQITDVSTFDGSTPQPAQCQIYNQSIEDNLAGTQSAHNDCQTNDNWDDSRVVLQSPDGSVSTHYQIGNCIGKGQFGSVYRALDLQTGEIVAIKRIRIDDVRFDDEIMQEVRLLSGMHSPHVVRYIGSVRDKVFLNIVLEYMENGSLLSTVKSFGRLPEKLVAIYVQRILRGLVYLHEHNVIHCDLKAANILTTKTGDVKLTDFGVSLNLGIRQANTSPAGTPNWMAPEVIELKGASPKSDIWSLGCTIVEMLTGKPPYAGMNSMSVLYHIVEDEHPPMPDHLSETVQDFLQACFQKNPDDRPTAQSLLGHPWISPRESRQSISLDKSEHNSNPAADDNKDDDDDFDLSIIFEFMKANPAMDSQRAPINKTPKTPLEHQFVKTTFGKALVCKLCTTTVKRNAVLCEACALICHEKCRSVAGSCRPIYPTTPSFDSLGQAPFPIPIHPRTPHNRFQKMLQSLYN